MAYDAAISRSRRRVDDHTERRGRRIWMSGGGPSSDGLATSLSPATALRRNTGAPTTPSALRSTLASSLVLADYFTPPIKQPQHHDRTWDRRRHAAPTQAAPYSPGDDLRKDGTIYLSIATTWVSSPRPQQLRAEFYWRLQDRSSFAF